MLIESGFWTVVNERRKQQKDCGFYRCFMMNAPVEVIEAASKVLQNCRLNFHQKKTILSAMNESTTPAMVQALKLFIFNTDIAQMEISPDQYIVNLKNVPESTIVELFKDLPPAAMMNGPIHYAFKGSDQMAKELLKTVDFDSEDKMGRNIVMVGIMQAPARILHSAMKRLFRTMPENYIDRKDQNGETATMLATKHSLPTLKELMSKITAQHINLIDKKGRNLLFHILSRTRKNQPTPDLDKEIGLELLDMTSVEERMIQDMDGMTLLMVAVMHGWDEDVIRAILDDTPPEYKNIQSKKSQQTAVMYYLKSYKKEQLSFSLFKLLMEDVEETSMALKDKDDNTVTFYALDYCQPINHGECQEDELRLYDFATYYACNKPAKCNEERMLVLSYLFERMTPEQRMIDVKEKVEIQKENHYFRPVTRTTTYLMMLLARVPTNMLRFPNVFNLLLKDTTAEWRMKGNGKVTPAILASNFDCLMNKAIFDSLIKDMPQEYLEKEFTFTYFRKGWKYTTTEGMLQTLLMSSKSNVVAYKLIPLLSWDHLYGMNYEFGTYLMSFVRNFPSYSGLMTFVKNCPAEMREQWLTAQNESGENVMHVFAKSMTAYVSDVLLNVLQMIPKSTLYAKDKAKRTPLACFLHCHMYESRKSAELLKAFFLLYIEDISVQNGARYSKYRSESIAVLVKLQMCFSLWLLDETIYGDVNGNTNTITLSDEDVLDILPWSGTTSPSITNEMIQYINLVVPASSKNGNRTYRQPDPSLSFGKFLSAL
eukprot:TRINITY_DN2053_c0_g2_i1.p1 TRINITY_DN2053_c0_g2~~TRINITY_DN2053_c0_g2_i1.p1  ORF type:complete len:855 (+),score=127.48 TRINITY_DN2053_c0_g2_i1:264-2567(+)